jgi:glyoxylase-like metal-dependent hydrolase (beta-lactamase superfamily II)
MVVANQPGLPDIVIEHHAHIFLGGKNVALYHFGRSHTNGDMVVLFPADRVLAAGDMFTKGDDVPELIDYSGGGSAVEWPGTLRSALQLDFDTVVPGHGPIATKQEMADFRQSTIRLVARVREMNRAKKSKDDIANMLKTEFHWADLHLARGLNGVIEEAQ